MKRSFLIVVLIATAITYMRFNLPIQKTQPQPVVVKDLTLEEYKALKNELISYIEQATPRVALEALQKRMDSDPAVLRSCHSLVHEVGRSSYRKYADFAEAMRYSERTCSFGYLHGVLEAYLTGTSDVVASIQKACSDYDANSFLGIECQHGVGHGLMYYTANNLPLSLSLCGTFTVEKARTICTSGVFMENFVADPEVHPSVFISHSDPFFPCNEQAAAHKPYCYMYTPMHFLLRYSDKYSEAMTACRTIEREYQTYCFYGVGVEITSRHINEPMVVQRTCDEGKGEQERASCIAGMVNRHVTYYGSLQPAKDLCEVIQWRYKPICRTAVDQAAKELFLTQ